jgi:NAD(P)-dependent dehydrogenase (short-subunit alcohol dehydrogenase family)
MTLPQIDLGGRRIIVTGAASGIGRETASLLRSAGAIVATLDVSDESQVRDLAFRVDVADAAEVATVVKTASTAMGGLDGLVNAAGVVSTVPILDTASHAVWERMLSINLSGTFNVCHAAAPNLLKNPSAAIVNIASGQGLRPMSNSAGYASSKAGVIALTRVLAQELAPAVRVNAVCPGLVRTPMIAELDPAAVNRLERAYALKRIAEPRDIANVVAFLLSDLASIVTGVALAADGGRSFH